MFQVSTACQWWGSAQPAASECWHNIHASTNSGTLLVCVIHIEQVCILKKINLYDLKALVSSLYVKQLGLRNCNVTPRSYLKIHENVQNSVCNRIASIPKILKISSSNSHGTVSKSVSMLCKTSRSSLVTCLKNLSKSVLPVLSYTP